MDEFPVKAMRQTLNQFVMLAKNRSELQKVTAPLHEVIQKYSNGLQGYAIMVLFSIVQAYRGNEVICGTGQCEMSTLSAVSNTMSSSTSSNHNSLGSSSSSSSTSTSEDTSERAWRCAFARNESRGQSVLLSRVLGLLSSLVPPLHEEAQHLTQELQALASLSTTSAASVALEARQLLLQRRLPSQHEELEVVGKALREAANAMNSNSHDGNSPITCNAVREGILEGLASQSNDVRTSLLAIMRDQKEDGTLCAAALECYLRKIYRPYVLFNIRPWSPSSSSPSSSFSTITTPAFFFHFSSESPELPTGIRPSASFSSLDGTAYSPSPSLSPRPSNSGESSAATVAEGAILLVSSLEALQQILPSLLREFQTTVLEERPVNAIHVVLTTEPTSSRDTFAKEATIRSYEQVLADCRGVLRAAGIARVTITQSSASQSVATRWELPVSFTFRARLNFQEDTLVRHIEPPLAYHLELHRLRNFSIRLIPLPDRSIHLYEATPKETTIVRGAALPRRKRFFVRAVCTNLDPLTTTSLTNTYPSAEKTLVEALNALEVGLGEARLRGEDEKYGGNHIFLNILPPAEVDTNIIEQVMRSLYFRYMQRLTQLHVSLVEMRLLPILTRGAQPVPIRMVGQDPTGLALRIDTYVETKDNLTGSVIFTSINENMGDAVGEWDGHSVNMAYPVLEPLERERAYAQKTSGTLYCYDFLELIQRTLQKRWKQYLRKCEGVSAVMPNTLMKVRELELVTDSAGEPRLKEVVRSPGKNKIGMVAWLMTIFTPTYPKEGRELVVICNDITHKAGSFGTQEDTFFDLVSKLARRRGIPRVFFAANSGARIGLADEVKEKFRVKWVKEDDPQSGVDYLYLTADDYAAIASSVLATPVQLRGQTVYRIDTVIGAQGDLGVENLAGSGLIAGETSRAYNDIVTLTVVTGRSVGIGAYLVRLGQRTIQKAEQAPIILTGYDALNQLMGRPVYASNDQLGGPSIMCPNGVTHLRVQNDIEGVEAMLRWLSFVPRTRSSPLVPQPLPASVDTINRAVTFQPTRLAYDVRHLLAGTEDPVSGEWQSGLFDKDSFMEVLGDWAKTVVVGRARLGGLPVGVVATENRTVEAVTPADPASPQSEQTVTQQAGGVWFPDSAFKTAQAIQDINQEGLPLFIIANWRGFSGGARDMFDEVLKFGSYIVDQLVAFRQPVFVYIPPFAELRGGAFVVVDSHINPRVMEMYADPEARAGVLEPSGVVAIKFRAADRLKAMRRTDGELERMIREASLAEDDKQRSDLDGQARAREKELGTAFQQVAEVFVDLHDRADRMQAVGVVRKVVPLSQARAYFYWRLKRRLREMEVMRVVAKAGKCTEEEAGATLQQWFLQSNHHRFNQACQWDNDEMVCQWMEREREDSIQQRITALQRQALKRDITEMGKENPYSVAEGVLDLISSLSGEVRERVVSTLKRGILLRTQTQTDFYGEEESFVEF